MLAVRTLCLMCVLLALSAGPGFATVVTYNDLTSWQNATVSGFNTDTFDSVGVSIGTSQQFTTGLLLGDGVSFYGYNGSSPNLIVWNQPQGPSDYYNFGSGPILVGPYYNGGSGQYINITLPAPVTSVGFDIMSFGASGVSFLATLNGGGTIYSATPTIAWNSSDPQRAFFGFTTTPDLPITSIQIIPPYGGTTPLLDNFRYGSAGSGDGTDTPEACTMLLIGLGLTGMAGLRRRIARVASTLRARPAQLKAETN